jgi:hypothetical protein
VPDREPLPATTAASGDHLDQLKKLSELRESGVLSSSG